MWRETRLLCRKASFLPFKVSLFGVILKVVRQACDDSCGRLVVGEFAHNAQLLSHFDQHSCWPVLCVYVSFSLLMTRLAVQMVNWIGLINVRRRTRVYWPNFSLFGYVNTNQVVRREVRRQSLLMESGISHSWMHFSVCTTCHTALVSLSITLDDDYSLSSKTLTVKEVCFRRTLEPWSHSPGDRRRETTVDKSKANKTQKTARTFDIYYLLPIPLILTQPIYKKAIDK